MNYFEKVTVNAQAINWLKEKYPELCIKAGLCERIGGRLYTKTFIDPPAAQRKPLTDERILHFVNTHVGGPSPGYPLDNSDWIDFARAIEAAHDIKEGA